MNISVEQSIPLLRRDPWLVPYADALARRQSYIEDLRTRIMPEGGELPAFATGHHHYGLHRLEDRWVLRERAPAASRIYLLGDFNAWQETYDFRLKPNHDGDWVLEIPLDRLKHGDHYKLRMYWREAGGEHGAERIPSHCRRVVQDAATKLFSAQVWDPPQPYAWRFPNFRVPKRAPRVYEAHVGMAQESAGVGTYAEFERSILPRIAAAGYNTIQLMAIQEHPYYGSFGYQVSNFFAPSSRFGTPEELMSLVDTAHGLGLAVIMDIVHSHAVKNEIEGLSRFDGSYSLYFHSGPKGEHPAWQTRCFDYGKPETLHFLLSNCRYWIEHFKFDGFRFDGVTSMLYWDHGLGTAFGSYDQYFDGNVDLDAVGYLSLANDLIHELRPDAITVAEDMSGMPGLAAPKAIGGVGFDCRLAMGVPDYWIKTIKERADEEWDVSNIWWELTNRRQDEKTISYAESHDQALVGDKTIIFRLADKEMYDFMRVGDESIVIDRAIALHKMIRLVTLASGGNGYLNFMGNEFGHPEWIDFPREGNNWSYHYARRQWSLRDNPSLRYHQLAEFDRGMMAVAEQSRLLEDDSIIKRYEHVAQMLLAFERAGCLFIFNFHPHRSYPDLEITVPSGKYRVVLDSDAATFGGFGRVDDSMTYQTLDSGAAGKAAEGVLKIYVPCRSALVLRR